ncbi:BCCT family transporter [Bacteroides acidifaciens]|jgi:BCCT family betaine/carnitine transporter|uniref:BCCT family transporter n=2 Tax=Bacteroides acidifaciens TaxID=85831 RepID=A0A4S2AYU6_9BACE|nr:BCCT family transporter [Bacteroides acidifaciens]TGY06778.1 BCCT family transporter [Bacteroides acidifaciens]
MNNQNLTEKKHIDWMITLLPLALVIALCIVFFIAPDTSNAVLSQIRFFFGDTLGAYYLIIGLGIFLISMFTACSKYGDIVLGKPNEKPKYSFFTWGSMMFTAGLAADILFYSFSEWFMYAVDPRVAELGSVQEWAGVFPIFHWSFIPWAFYLVLAVAFGFMLHVRKRERQKYSEACRPLLGKYTDGWAGRIIDLLAVFALIAGTATTFSVATPLMAGIVNSLFGLNLDTTIVTIIILVITCCIYTYALLHGFRGISFLAKACIYMFFGLLVYVLLFGGETKYIIETGLSSLGRVIQNFFELSTYADPQRTSSFPQNWTIYYWAYWMVWCVAAPFFIGSISKGRTVRQTILGGYGFGVGSTIVSFIVLGNYSMGLQTSDTVNFLVKYTETGDAYTLITDIIGTMPCAPFVFALVLFTMIAFYCTSFDSIALTVSTYSYRKLKDGEMPHKLIQLLWCVLLILLPIALVFAESSMRSLQTVSIVAAFPIGAVMVMIVWSFLKDAKKYMSGDKEE